MMFSASVYDDDGNVLLTGLTVMPRQLIASRYGGPQLAECVVKGDEIGLNEVMRWLGCYLHLEDSNRQKVWWGKIDEVLNGRNGLGVSLATMRNRVKVMYTHTTPDGDISGETTWAENPQSIDRYGRREVIVSQSDMSPHEAEMLRDKILHGAQGGGVPGSAWPRLLPDERARGGHQATVRAMGMYAILDWVYYQDLSGKHVHNPSASYAQPLGWGLTSNQVGFSKMGMLYDISGALLQKDRVLLDQPVRVHGSTLNDGVYVFESVSEQPFQTYTSTKIWLEPADDIWDEAGGLGWLRVKDLVVISGTAHWNLAGIVGKMRGVRGFELDLSVDHPLEESGHPVTITRPHYIEIDDESGTFAEEGVGATITVQSIQDLWQTIVIPVDTPSWVLGEISVKLGKVGNPSWPLRLELHRVTSAPSDIENWNSTHLWSGEIDPSTVYEAADWVSLAVNPVEAVDEETEETVMQDVVIEPGAYGLMVRCPQLDTANYYEVILEEPGTYDGKTFYMQDEATEEWIEVQYHSNASDISVYDGIWRVHDEDVDLVFEMWGVLPIETQMKQMIETAWDGWTAVDVLLETGISTRQYREGTTTCKYELEKLLKLAGPDVVVDHTMDGAMIIRRAVAGLDGAGLTGTGYMLRDDGKLADGMGRPLDGCVLPAGQFVELPDSAKEIDGVLGMERFLVDKAEYVVTQDELILSPVGAVDPWDHWIED